MRFNRTRNNAASALDALPGTINFDAGRRAFVRSVGLASAGIALVGAGGLGVGEAQAGGVTDEQVLNFALNLEYLEAEFYLRGAFGRGLAAEDTTGQGPRGDVVGGTQVPFDTPAFRQYAEEIAGDEEAHVKFLRAALGGAAVARPRINLRQSFTIAARAAGLIGPNEQFDAFANENNFLLAAFIFEDVGVTAYKGAARLITNKDVLEAAAGILAVEAYHAGEIRTLLFQLGFNSQTKAISDLRDSVDGQRNLDQGTLKEGRINIVPTNSNGIAFSRSTRQVLNIVYLGGQDDGGFYPNGLNGDIS